MEKMTTLKLSGLKHLEFAQLLRDTITEIDLSHVSLLASDEPLLSYMKMLSSGIYSFETAVRSLEKSPFSELLFQKNQIRDAALSRFGRKLSFYELSIKSNEQRAYNTLIGLWKLHRNNKLLNLDGQTLAIDELLIGLKKEPYASATSVLCLMDEIETIKTTNDNFRKMAEDKRAQKADQEYNDVKNRRNQLMDAYTTLANYVETLAFAYPDNKEWNTILHSVDCIRQNYQNSLVENRLKMDPFL